MVLQHSSVGKSLQLALNKIIANVPSYAVIPFIAYSTYFIFKSTIFRILVFFNIHVSALLDITCAVLVFRNGVGY